MEFFRIKHDIPFMRYGKITTAISLITFLFAIWALAARGLNLGIDFTGGTLIEVTFNQPANIDQVRQTLEQARIKDASVQVFGASNDVLIRLPLHGNIGNSKSSDAVINALHSLDASVTPKRVDFVGPQVGSELYNNGALALMVVAGGILIYLALRFEWRFALAAIIANVHDVVIILGCFAFFQWEFNLTVLAGILAVLGYSVNESVVVFDRIRENMRKMRKATIPQIIDNAITTTMSRTIITHGMTETMVLSMLFFGGDALHNFALALTIGILFGIYSSVLVASPLLLMFGVKREHFLKSATKAEVSANGAQV